MDNIRVTIRVRPLVQREILKEAESHWEVNENTIYQVENGIPVPSNPFNPTTFVFDRVYSEGDSTESIYDQFAKPLVCKAMEGFNGTIFAYGQTGTGKTFTMMGEPDNPGITPRTISDIFSMVQMAPDREFLIRVSYMEIYNEVITDLLKAEGSNLKIRNNERNEIFVEHLTEVPISSPVDALTCLENGEQRRRFGVTNMNERSSRSHTIFRITIESKLTNANDSCCEDGAVIVSQLNLVDLAGSERAAQTGAQGTRLKESGYINKSLLALGTVISKLSSAGDERAFIPYRDSKLTRILQNSLGGNAKTSVIATVSSAAGEETFSTLKFASRAKTIKNKPTVNEVLDGDTMIRRYRKEINMLKQQIDEMNSLTKVKTLMTENEKMEQLLEENERKREEQELKINGLQKLIISASEQTISLKRKASSKLARRETWCPGKLKRSLATVSILDAITDQESEDDDEKEPTFSESKTNFMRELDREERRSCEEFKRKRSKDSGSAAVVKYRRSYQAGTLVELKIDRSCQTELSEAARLQDVIVEQETEKEGSLMERLTMLLEENAGLTTTIQRLTNRLEELESQCLSDETKDQNARRNLVGTRRRSVSAAYDLLPSAKKKKHMSTPNVERSFCREIPRSQTPATSKLEKTVNDSLLEFMDFEKDFKIEELIGKLNEAQSTIADLKKFENAVEDLQYKNDELSLENEALKEKDRKQSSHLELLAKENFELQRDMNTDNGNHSAECESADLKAELAALKEEKENILRELDEERSFRKNDAERDPEKMELKKKISDLKSLNEAHQGGIEYKNSTLKENEEHVAAKELEMGLIDTETINVDLDEETKSKEDTYEEVYKRMRTEAEELHSVKMKLERIEEKNRELLDDKMEMLKQIENQNAEKCLLKERFDEMSLKVAQLEKINEAAMKSMDGDWKHTEEQYWLQGEEVEKLTMIVNELEELSQTLFNNVSHKERFIEETVDENDKEVEKGGVGMKDLEVNDTVQQTEGNAEIEEGSIKKYVEIGSTRATMSETKGSNDDLHEQAVGKNSINETSCSCVRRKLETLKLKLKELTQGEIHFCNAVSNKNLLDENNCLQEELEVLQLKLNEMEKSSRGLRDEIASKNSLSQSVCLQEELEVLQLKLEEMENSNKELRDEIASKNSLSQNVCLQEEMEVLQLKLEEMENSNKELRDEIASKNSLSQNVCLHEEMEVLQLKLEEMENSNKELRDEIASKNSLSQNVCLQEEMEVLQLKLEEMENSNKELRDEIASKNSLSQNVCLQEEMEVLQLKLEEMENSNKELRDEIASKNSLSQNVCLQEEMEVLQLKLEEMENSNKELRDEIASKNSLSQNVCLQEEMEVLQLKLEEMENSNKELRDEIASKNSLSQNVCLQEEMEKSSEKLKNQNDSMHKEEINEMKVRLIELEERNYIFQQEIVEQNVLIQNQKEEASRGLAEGEEMKSQLLKLEEINEELVAELREFKINQGSEINQLLKSELEETKEKLIELKKETLEEGAMEGNSKEEENRMKEIKSLKEELSEIDDVRKVDESYDEHMEHVTLKIVELEEENEELRSELIAANLFEKERNELLEKLSNLEGELHLLESQNKELAEKVNEEDEPQKDVACKDAYTQEVDVEVYLREHEFEDMKLRLQLVEIENKGLRKEIDDRKTAMKDKLFNLEVENEKLYEEVQAKCTLVKEKEMEAARHASSVEDLKLQMVNLQTKIEHLTAELKLKCSLLEEQEEDVKKYITVEEAEELKSKYIELQEVNEGLSEELSQKNDLLKDNSEVEELKKKIIDLEMSAAELLKEIESKSFLIAKQEEEISKKEEALIDEERMVGKVRQKLADSENASEELCKELASTSAILEELQEEMKKVEDSLAIAKQEREIAENLKEELCKELSSKSSLLNELQEDMKRAEDALAIAKQEREDAENLKEELFKELSSKSSLLSELQEDMKRAEDALAIAKQEREDAENLKEELYKELSSKSSLLSELQEDMKRAEDALAIAKQERENAENLKEELCKELSSKSSLLSELQEDMKRAEDALAIAKQEREDAENLKEELFKELSSKSSLLNELQEDMKKAEDALAREKEEKENVENKLAGLQELNMELLKKTESQSKRLEEKEEEMKNCIKIENAEALRLKFIELQEANEELRLELSDKENIVKEQMDVKKLPQEVAVLEEQLRNTEEIVRSEKDKLEEVERKLKDFEERNRELHNEMCLKIDALKEKEEELHIERVGKIDECRKSEEMEKKLDQIKAMNEDLQLEVEAKSDLLKELSLERENFVDAQKLEELQARFDELQVKNKDLHNEIIEKCTLLSEKEDKLEDYLENAKEFRCKLEELSSENSELRKEIATKNELLNKSEKDKKNLSEMEDFEAMNNEFRKAMLEKETEISLLKSKAEDAKTKIQEEIDLKENAKENVMLLEKRVEDMKVTIDDLTKMLEKARNDQKINANLDAEEIDELSREIRELNATIEKERKAAQEQFTKIEKYYLEKLKKQRGEVCIGVSLEKENRKLKEQLEKNERARISYEEYQEKRVAGLKSELKKLQEQSSMADEHEQGKLHSVMDNANLFTLKAEKANLKRENGKLKGEVDDLNKKNASLAFEKYNFESKCDSLKAECSKLKRGVKGETSCAQTQTDSVWKRHTHSERAFRSQENKRQEVDSKVRLFMEKDEEPGQCAQQ